ncbi:hypothetical protein BXZ70DRAFT_963183 [Cristinia sonorae]|uniref:Uncharacterized protein n=1 Tax=Cristinia sonorae TaxID=1940300 RepID=A0A8K0XJN7_9AGAR|nr:hypothetical protein BXZ70DRAFT_963183 [Cristinia sonorae]
MSLPKNRGDGSASQNRWDWKVTADVEVMGVKLSKSASRSGRISGRNGRTRPPRHTASPGGSEFPTSSTSRLSGALNPATHSWSNHDALASYYLPPPRRYAETSSLAPPSVSHTAEGSLTIAPSTSSASYLDSATAYSASIDMPSVEEHAKGGVARKIVAGSTQHQREYAFDVKDPHSLCFIGPPVPPREKPLRNLRSKVAIWQIQPVFSRKDRNHRSQLRDLQDFTNQAALYTPQAIELYCEPRGDTVVAVLPRRGDNIALIEHAEFLEDLYHRLNQISLDRASSVIKKEYAHTLGLITNATWTLREHLGHLIQAKHASYSTARSNVLHVLNQHLLQLNERARELSGMTLHKLPNPAVLLARIEEESGPSPFETSVARVTQLYQQLEHQRTVVAQIEHADPEAQRLRSDLINKIDCSLQETVDIWEALLDMKRCAIFKDAEEKLIEAERGLGSLLLYLERQQYEHCALKTSTSGSSSVDANGSGEEEEDAALVDAKLQSINEFNYDHVMRLRNLFHPLVYMFWPTIQHPIQTDSRLCDRFHAFLYGVRSCALKRHQFDLGLVGDIGASKRHPEYIIRTLEDLFERFAKMFQLTHAEADNIYDVDINFKISKDWGELLGEYEFILGTFMDLAHQVSCGDDANLESRRIAFLASVQEVVTKEPDVTNVLVNKCATDRT